MGCIFGELWLRRILFMGERDSDIDQLALIFALRGNPTEKSWPDAFKLKDFKEFSSCSAQKLNTIFPSLSKNGIDLLDKLL